MLCQLWFISYVRLQSPMVKPKSDGQAKVRRSAPKSNGLLEIGTPKPDGYDGWCLLQTLNAKVRRSNTPKSNVPPFVYAQRYSVVAPKKLRLWRHVMRTLLETSIINTFKSKNPKMDATGLQDEGLFLRKLGKSERRMTPIRSSSGPF